MHAIMVVCFVFRSMAHLSGERGTHQAAVVETFADRVALMSILLILLLQHSIPDRLELLGLLGALRAADR